MRHDDRDVEFILLKREVEQAIRDQNGVGTDGWSCERWARHLVESLDLVRCEVSEDGENGAVVEV